MVKISKYSRGEFLKLIKLLDNHVYLLFYDLDQMKFSDTKKRLSNYMEIVGTKTIRKSGIDCLIVFGCLDDLKFEKLISELDSMDISEFDVSEYQKRVYINMLNFPFYADKKDIFRRIYVNKDERIIQLYNFQ